MAFIRCEAQKVGVHTPANVTEQAPRMRAHSASNSEKDAMNTWSMIDPSKPITLSAHGHAGLNAPTRVGKAVELNLPQVRYLSAQIEGTPGVEIQSAGSFLGWLQTTAWGASLEKGLQCISQDSAGLSLLTTWLAMEAFELFVDDAQGSTYGAQLQRCLDEWTAIGADEVALTGFKLATAGPGLSSASGAAVRSTSPQGRAATMNRYELENAAVKVDGYYSPPRDADHVERQFRAAQAECVGHLRRQLEQVQALSLEQFLQGRRGGGAPCARPTGPDGEPCGSRSKPCVACQYPA